MTPVGFRFHPAATEELQAAGEWYDEQSAGLSFELLGEVDDAIRLIVERPDAWQRTDVVAGQSIRRFVMQRFPYSVVYYVADNVVRIVAMAHAKRMPGYWRDQVKDPR